MPDKKDDIPVARVVMVKTGQEGLPLAHPAVGAKPGYEQVAKVVREIQEAIELGAESKNTKTFLR